MRGLPAAFFAFDLPGLGAGRAGASRTLTSAKTTIKTTAKTV